MALQEIRELNVQLLDRYESVAKEMMAYLATLSGDHYDPAKGEVSQRINKARGMATALVALFSSLHAYHPPFISTGVDGTAPETTNPIPPTPPTPPQMQNPPPAE